MRDWKTFVGLILSLLMESSNAQNLNKHLKLRALQADATIVPGHQRLNSVLRNSDIHALDKEEKAIREWALYNEHRKNKISRIYPRAFHDCGLYGNDCNYRGAGPDKQAIGSFMKQGHLQSLDETRELASEVLFTLSYLFNLQCCFCK